ncbi:TerB family tellurite resistance protein [Pelobium manganitolerans]|uniref:TerB family tellurite resistance protein n=1 Tax=Pelobium manganitolerans TaxID=1842495 RepID=UPI003FA35D0B
MKKLILIVFISFSAFSAFCQSAEVKQLMLNIEKLRQLKSILSDMKKGYTVLNNGYMTIKNLSEGNFKLHELFLNKMLQINPQVRKYYKVREIIKIQLASIKTCKNTLSETATLQNFSADHIKYIRDVTDHVRDMAIQSLEDLTSVLTANHYRMTDNERLEEIDRIYETVLKQNTFLHRFISDNTVLARAMRKAKGDIESIKHLHHLD